MDEIPVSKFKAHCAEVLDEVARTGKTVTITKRGRPIAEITPPKPALSRAQQLGCMAGTAEIVGDIDGPIWTEDELAEMEAEWLQNWDEIQAKGRAIAARNKREAKNLRKARSKR